MTDLEKLTQQILSQWGNTGDWNQGGINRADELARLLAANGVTDISQLGAPKEGSYTTKAENHLGDFYDVNNTGNFWQLGDKQIGYLGDVNNDNTLGKVGEQQFFQNGQQLPDGSYEYDKIYGGPTIGWSAQGDGNVRYVLQDDGSVAPVWGSSSDADSFRNAAKAAAAFAAIVSGAGAMGLTGEAAGAAGAAGGAGGISAADIGLMADLGGTTLTPSMWSTAFPELAAAGGLTGGLSTMAGLPEVPSALAPLSPVAGAEALPALAATPAVPSLASVGLGAGAGALGASGLLKLGTAALGAAAGSQKSDDTTSTNTRTLDPRIDQRVFGSGGLMELADKQLAANPTGQNDTMRQGQNMLRGLLSNPDVLSGLGQMAGRGQSMMNSPIAGNPFLNWKFPGV